jgi:hypothetical protein
MMRDDTYADLLERYVTFEQLSTALPAQLKLSKAALDALSRRGAMTIVRSDLGRLYSRNDLLAYVARRGPHLVEELRSNFERLSPREDHTEDDGDSSVPDSERRFAGLGIEPHELGLTSPVSFVHAMILATWRRDPHSPESSYGPFLVYPWGVHGAKANATNDVKTLREIWRAGGDDARNDLWRLKGGSENNLHILEFESQREVAFLEEQVCALPDTWTLSSESGALVMLFRAHPKRDPQDLLYNAPILGARVWLRDSAALPHKAKWHWHKHAFPTRVPLSPLPRAFLSLMQRKWKHFPAFAREEFDS